MTTNHNPPEAIAADECPWCASITADGCDCPRCDAPVALAVKVITYETRYGQWASLTVLAGECTTCGQVVELDDTDGPVVAALLAADAKAKAEAAPDAHLEAAYDDRDAEVD